MFSLGEVSGFSASLHDPFQFYKARQVPYSLKNKAEAELIGVKSLVKFSEWAAPLCL